MPLPSRAFLCYDSRIMQTLYEWLADKELSVLIRRYYTGEASLWPDICACIDAELGRHGVQSGAYHIRLLRTDVGYSVRIYEASEYAIDHSAS